MTDRTLDELADDPQFYARCVALDERFEAGEYLTIQECADFVGLPVYDFICIFGSILLPHVIVPPPVRPPLLN